MTIKATGAVTASVANTAKRAIVIVGMAIALGNPLKFEEKVRQLMPCLSRAYPPKPPPIHLHPTHLHPQPTCTLIALANPLKFEEKVLAKNTLSFFRLSLACPPKPPSAHLQPNPPAR
jgi:hypothetical protein